MRIPDQGRTSEQILETLRGYGESDIRWLEGRAFTSLFVGDEQGKTLAEDAYRMYLWENGLDPTQFPSLLRLETEIVAMAREHLRGDEAVTGSFTSGGTESCMLAVKAARDRARAARPDLAGRPQLILPVTAHPCFHKAAHYLDVETVVLPVDARTCKVDPAAVRAAITDRTIMLVGSAPSYAHGVVDPIPELGEIALEHELHLHVDGCIGGFLLPFFRELGAAVTPFDFEVPGVTSISMDFHKYAFAAKGASVVLYRDAERWRHQLFTYSGWPGYTLVNPTIQSSRSGGPLAATWAVLHHFGRDGYRRHAAALKESTERIAAAIDEQEDLFVLGRPEMSLIAFSSRTLDVFALGEALRRRGWVMYPQFRLGELPENLHLTVLPCNVEMIDAFIVELREAIAELRGTAAAAPGPLARLLQTVDLGALSDEELRVLVGSVLDGGDGEPGASAEVNGLLNQLPAALKDRIVAIFYEQLGRRAARAPAAQAL